MTELTANEIVLLREKLGALKADFQSAIEQCQNRTGTVHLDQTSTGRLTRMDALQQQSMAQANLAQYEMQLKQIAAALRKINEADESGLTDYGFCAKCDEPIGFARLNIKPQTPLCLNCQAKSEQQ